MNNPKPSDPIKMPGWLFYPLSAVTLGLVFLLIRRGDIVAAVTVVLIALSGGIGFRTGLARIAATFCALTAAIYFAPALGMKYETQFSQQFGTTGLTNRLLCMTSIGVVISLVVTIFVSWIGGRFLAQRRKLSWLNCFSGFAVGLVEGGAIVLLALGGLLSLQMWQRDSEQNQANNQNRVGKAVDEWASKTRQSVVGPIVRDYNPFEKIEALASVNQLHRTVQQMGDPQKVSKLLGDQKIAALRADPAVATAIDDIRRDPALADLFDKKRPLDRELLMYLMSKPSVMHLMDDPQFVEQAAAVIQTMK